VLVFIHGYNVDFESAAKRAAKSHYDLDFPGVTLFYSWPSGGALTQYVSDMADAVWTAGHLAKFLMDLEARDVDDIFVLAHSMGNRALLQALRQIQSAGGGKKFKELGLAAADVDSQLFTEQMVRADHSAYEVELLESMLLECVVDPRALLRRMLGLNHPLIVAARDRAPPDKEQGQADT